MTDASRIPRPLAHQHGQICSWCRVLVPAGTWDGRDHWVAHQEWHLTPRNLGETNA